MNIRVVLAGVAAAGTPHGGGDSNSENILTKVETASGLNLSWDLPMYLEHAFDTRPACPQKEDGGLG